MYVPKMQKQTKTKEVLKLFCAHQNKIIGLNYSTYSFHILKTWVVSITDHTDPGVKFFESTSDSHI